MDEYAPSLQTTLAILLGASAWPDFADFHSSAAFANVARDFRTYLLNPQQFGLPEENFLDLFDTEQGPEKIDRTLRTFLDQRTTAMREAGKPPRDLLFYFVGHGGFAGRKSEYYLAVRCTSSENPGASGIRIESLATTLMDKARHLRRFIILDCCYAAAAFSEFQAEGPAQVAVRQAVDAFTDRARRIGRKGTALLCSSGKKVTSLIAPDGNATMFSKALLQVLTTTGNSQRPDRAFLSLYEVADLVEEALEQLLPAEKAPRPELHSPDQVEGDVADVPFFPNPVAVGATLTADTLTGPVEREFERGRLGNYRLVRLLGEGGFAEVYLGEHVHLGTQAAIKVLHTQLTQSDLEAFRDEARIIAHLDHPHIVRVLDYGVENKTPFLVMSYAPGGTLRHLHPRGTRLPLSTIVTYVNQVAGALQYAHRQKLIHRDVRPENMLMGWHNEVLLSDFGIAVIAHSTASQKVETPAGTFAYTAPEQFRGHPLPASDQYSLGVVVYEWLCGDRPFQGTLQEVALQHAMPPPPSLRQKGIEIPPEVEQVVMIALAKKSEERFVSITAFAHALEQASLLNSPPVPVPPVPEPPPAPPEPWWKRLPRRSVLVGGIGLASLAVVGGGFAVVSPLTKPARGTRFYTLPLDDIVYDVAWSPDGTYLAAARNALGVQVWDAASGTYALTYSFTAPVIAGAVAWSPDGKYLATGGSDGTVQVWDALTMRTFIHPIHTGHTGYTKVVNALAWSPDGKYLVSAGEDGYIKVWDARTEHLTYTYKGHIGQYGGSSVNAVAWSPDSTRIASASDDQTVQVWDATTGSHAFSYKQHSDPVLAVAWSPDGTRIASGSADTTVQVWIPSQSAPETSKYSGHTASVNAVAWSSDGQHLASGSGDTTVRVWDLSSTGSPYVYQGHKDEVYTVAWSPGGFPWPWSHEGQRLASGGKDQTVCLWQAV